MFLLDGPFENEKKDLTLMFRGSWNQRMIDIQKTIKTGAVVQLYPDLQQMES
jgi:anaerobic ribonucleoside-triphosphate reductase activating protein